MDFKAELVNGEMIVKPIVEKIGNDIIIHVPSLPIIETKLRELGHGKVEKVTKDIQAIGVKK